MSNSSHIVDRNNIVLGININSTGAWFSYVW